MSTLSSLSSLTHRFAFLTRWFRRQDDFDDTAAAVATAEPTRSTVHGHGHGAGNGNHNGNGDHKGNGRGSGSFLRRRSSREAQLQHAYDEVIELVTTLKHHMESQAERSERLLAHMEGLPEALKSLPEANRNQTQTLQAIEGHLKQQNQHTEGLTQAIQGMATVAGNQEHAMGLIQQQLDAGQASREQMHESFAALSNTLHHMSDSNQAGTQLLNRLNEKQQQSEAQMQQLVMRNQRQMTMMSIVSWSLAIVALAVAAAVAVSVGRQATEASAQPGASAGAQVAGVAQPVDDAVDAAGQAPVDATAPTSEATADPTTHSAAAGATLNDGGDLSDWQPFADPYRDLLRIEPTPSDN